MVKELAVLEKIAAVLADGQLVIWQDKEGALKGKGDVPGRPAASGGFAEAFWREIPFRGDALLARVPIHPLVPGGPPSAMLREALQKAFASKQL